MARTLPHILPRDSGGLSGGIEEQELKTLEPTSNENEIVCNENARETEFEVQAYLYWALRSAGLKVRGEFVWRLVQKRRRCRFDLLLYRNGNPAHIIEIKARPVKHKTCVDDTRQCKRYRTFGIPVTFVYGLADADEFMRLALDGKV